MYNVILSYRLFVALFGYFITLLVILGMFGLYIGIIYPELPQEFGGPRARCADIILEPRAVSAQAWEKFGVKLTTIPADASGAGQLEPTGFFTRAKVLYSDDKVVVFRPDDGSPERGSIEIRKDLVRGLVWCRE